MNRQLSENIQTALLALGLSGVLFFLQRDFRIFWADEGFLWYGIHAVQQGGVPIRDFQSYEPFRYYWGACLSPLFGGELLGLRTAFWLFQALCLWAGLTVIRSVERSWLISSLTIFIVYLWQIWTFRTVDSGYPILLTWAAWKLFKSPSSRHFFVAGLFGGLSLWIGLNHALYTALAMLMTAALLKWKGEAGTISAGIYPVLAGVAAGLIPLLFMMVVLPGFAQVYTERLVYIVSDAIRHGSDVRAPILWPWQWSFASGQAADNWATGMIQLSERSLGVVFLMLPALYAAAGVILFRILKKTISSHALLAASMCVGLPYLHHAFARSDATHLGEAIFPFVSVLCALAAGFSQSRHRTIGRAAQFVFLVLSLSTALVQTNLFLRVVTPKTELRPVQVFGQRLWVYPQDERWLNSMQRLTAKTLEPGQKVLVLSSLTTLTRLLDRLSPAYQIYFFKPLSEREERRLIEELEIGEVPWVIAQGDPFEKMNEAGYADTRKKLREYLHRHYEMTAGAELPDGHALLKRKRVDGAGLSGASR